MADAATSVTNPISWIQLACLILLMIERCIKYFLKHVVHSNCVVSGCGCTGDASVDMVQEAVDATDAGSSINYKTPVSSAEESFIHKIEQEVANAAESEAEALGKNFISKFI